MKKLTTLSTFFLISTLCISQSYQENTSITRGLESTKTQTSRSIIQPKQLAQLTFDMPKIASDQSILAISSPNYASFYLRIFEYLEDSIVWQKRLWIFPGQQQIPLHLYDLDEGEYTLTIYREEEVLAYRYFEVKR